MECLKILVLIFVCVKSDSKSPFKSISDKWSIELKRDFTNYKVIDSFDVSWNVPTYLCENINFEDKLKPFEIIVNTGNKFRGDKVLILYDPGDFPLTIKLENGTLIEKNGGVPQKGNLTKHLEAFKKVVEDEVPQDFNGLGVIDFEFWRPVFRQNWNNQTIYKSKSIELVKQNASLTKLDDKQVNATATVNFEEAARQFMEQTLKKAKQLRPSAKWGFYGYPYCYGFRGEWTPHCPSGVDKENNKIKWLFNESTALYPSIYVSSNLTTKEQEGFYVGKLNEAFRMASNVSKGNKDFPPVYPYFWFRYNNNDTFLSEIDTKQALEITKKYKMGGMIIWGSSDNVNTKEKCENLLKYMENIFGPALLEVTGKTKQNIIHPLGISDKTDQSKPDTQTQQVQIGN